MILILRSNAVKLLCFAIFFMASHVSWAQFNYNYSASRATYVPITGTNDTLVSGTTDDGVYQTIDIPFTFVYNRQNFTQVTPNTNGVIFMGSNGGSAYGQFLDGQTRTDLPTLQALFPAAGDLKALNGAGAASVKHTTLGTAPNRRFVVQYTNFTLSTQTGITYGNMNFQVVLNELNNTVQFNYGSWVCPDESGVLTVGIRGDGLDNYTLGRSLGASGADTTEWINPLRSNTIGAGLTYNRVVKANTGVVYTFTPFAAPAGVDRSVLSITPPRTSAMGDSSELYFTMIIRNEGNTASATNNFNISIKETSTGNPIESRVVSSTRNLAFTERDTILVGPLLVGRINNYTITAICADADVNAANDTARATFDVVAQVRKVAYNSNITTGTYTALTGGTVLNTNEAYDDSYQVPLSSPFWYNGTYYSSVNVNVNGFITFGSRLSNTLTSPVRLPNFVSAFGADLIAPAGGITYATRGTSLVIQYANMFQSNLAGTDSANYNFQIILNANNTIDFVYGNMGYRSSNFPARNFAGVIGLSGAADSVFTNYINRGSSMTWADLVFGYSYNDSTNISPLMTVPTGFTISWAPRYFSAIDLAVLAVLNTPQSSCSGSALTPKVVLYNSGNSPISAAIIRAFLALEGNNSPTPVANINYTPSTPLAVGAHDTISLGAVAYDNAGINGLIALGFVVGDGNEANNSAYSLTIIKQTKPLVYSDSIVCTGTRKVVRFAKNSGTRYYANSSMSTLLATDSLVYSSLSRDTSFYMVPPTTSDATIGGMTVANTPLSGAAQNAGLYIQTFVNATLSKVTVYPIAGGGATFTINLVDSVSGQIVASTPYTVDAARLNLGQSVTLSGFNLQAGKVYLLTTNGMGSVRLHRDNRTGPNTPAFPMFINGIGFVKKGYNGISLLNVYYYFYNLEFAGSENCGIGATYRLRVGTAATSTPTITASGATTLCPGDSVILSAPAGAAYYRWNNGEITRSITVKNNGSFLVQTAALGGCFSTASSATVVILNTAPATRTITSSGPTNICGAGSVTLTASANAAPTAQYLWSNGATTQSITVSTTGTYSVRTRNSATTCYSLNSAPVQVNIGNAGTAPLIAASRALSFCPGDSVVLTTTTVASYYIWSNGATTSSITVRNTGTYTLQVGSSPACLSPVSNSIATVLNNAPSQPTISTSGSTAFCSGAGSVTLTANGGTSYLWSNGATTPSITVTTAGTFTVQALGAGCPSIASAPVTVTVGSAPNTPMITAGSATTFCAGGQVILSSGTDVQYVWSDNSISRTLLVTQSGTYSVRTINAAGCTSAISNTITVTVTPLPTRANITATGNTSLCPNATVILNALSGSSSYEWFNGATSVATTQNFTASAAGTYYVRTSNGACTSANSDFIVVTTLTAPNPPVITPLGATSFCSGLSVQLNAPASARYLWNDGDTNQTRVVNTSGVYTLRVINAAGCTSEASTAVTITVNATPTTPSLLVRGDSLIASGTTAATYTWYRNGVEFAQSTLNAIFVTNTGTNNYSVKASNGPCVSDSSNSLVLNTISKNRNADFRVYPVPAQSSVKVSLNEVLGSKAIITVVDALGKEVMSQELSINGSVDTELDITAIPAGTYRVVLKADNLLVNKALIKN